MTIQTQAILQYQRESTLLPMRSQEFHSISRVPLSELPDAELLAYDGEASHFWFENKPEEDIQCFVSKSTMCSRGNGVMVACRENLLQIVAALREKPRIDALNEVVISTEGDLPLPLQDVPHQAALEALKQEGNWLGQITCCTCGIDGCGSQYAWIERGVCLFLFTVSGASLVQVDVFPFRVVSK